MKTFARAGATVATGAALVIAGLGPVLAAEAAAPTTRPSTGSVNAKAVEGRSGGATTKATPGIVTVMWGRSNWSVATGAGCKFTPPGARNLEQNLIDLRSRDLESLPGFFETEQNRFSFSDGECTSAKNEKFIILC